jgi:hypothetical protein
VPWGYKNATVGCDYLIIRSIARSDRDFGRVAYYMHGPLIS